MQQHQALVRTSRLPPAGPPSCWADTSEGLGASSTRAAPGTELRNVPPPPAGVSVGLALTHCCVSQ